MRQNNFFATMATKMLGLAVVMMMGIGFTACSKDNGDDPKTKQEEQKEDPKPEPTPQPDPKPDPKPEPTPEPEPEKFTNTVTFDSKEVKVKAASLTNVQNNIYWLTLEVEEGSGAAQIVVSFIPGIHNTGKEIVLSEQSKDANINNSWSIMVLSTAQIICCGQQALNPEYQFKSGKMVLKVDMETKEVELEITDAKILTSADKGFGDGTEHNFSISYKGVAEVQNADI